MAKKSQIYLSQRAQEVLGALSADESLSGRVNAVIDRYGAIIASAAPTLSADDLHMVRVACISWATALEPAEILIGGIAAEVEDAALPGGDLEGRYVAALITRLVAMSPAEQLAIIEAIEAERRRST